MSNYLLKIIAISFLAIILVSYQNCTPSFQSSNDIEASSFDTETSNLSPTTNGDIERFITRKTKNEKATVNKVWQLRSDNYYAKVESAFKEKINEDIKFWTSSKTTNYNINIEFSDLDKLNLEKVLDFADKYTANLPSQFIDDCSAKYSDCMKSILQKLFSNYSAKDLEEYILINDSLKKEGFSEEESLKAVIKHALVDNKTLFLLDTEDNKLGSQDFFEQYLKIYNDEPSSNYVKKHGAKIITSFLIQFFETDGITLITKTDEEFQKNLEANKKALLASANSFFQSVSSQGGDLDELMYADLTPFVSSLSYLKSARRRGILHHPTYLALNSNAGSTNPTARGITVFSKLLCQQIPALPRDIDVTLQVPDKEGMTKRQALIAHSTSPACASCHKALDPPGFALENFDSVGNFRLKENNQEIDASADMSRIPLSSFQSTDYMEFIEKVKDTKEYKLCMTINFVEFLMGRELVNDDVNFIRSSYQELTNNNNQLDAVLKYYINNKLRN